MKKAKKCLSILIVLMMLTAVVTGCSGNAKSENAGQTKVSGESEKIEPEQGEGRETKAAANGISRIIVLAQGQDMTSFDPHKHNDVESGTGTRMIYDTLIRLTTDNQFVGQLAESWEYLDDKTVAFTLKDGVKFHNGEPLTAEDVKFSLDRQKQSGIVGHLVSMIDSVEVVDNLHFTIHLGDGAAALLSSLSHMGSSILCKSHVEGLESSGKTIDDDPVGTGPYKFDYWTVGSEWQMLRNADYFDPEYAAKNEGLKVKVIAEETSRTIALETGEVDFLIQVPSVSVDSIASNPDLKLLEYESTHLAFIAFNCSKAPFDNQKLREAVSYCINRDDIIQVQVNGKAVPNDTCIGKAAIGYTDDVVKREYNIDKAKELLAEAGYADGFSFTLTTLGEERARAAAVIQAACAEAGIDVKIEVLENSAYFDKVGLGEHEAGMSWWVANAEPDNSFNPLFNSNTIATGGSNYACYNSPEIDGLLLKGQTTNDQTERVKYYEDIAKIISENAVWCPLFSQNGYLACRSNIDGVVIYSIDMHLYQGLHVTE